MDRHTKHLNALISRIAYEDPNEFIARVYHAGMEKEDILDLRWAINIARRAPGYNSQLDALQQNDII